MAEEKGSSAGTDALEGFVVLAKQSTGKQCVLVIQQVLKHPAIYVFGELLTEPSIVNLEGTPQKPWLDLLRLFAYGTYTDYKAQATSNNLPPLGDKELKKLKQLSIVSRAAQSQTLVYQTLMDELDVKELREMEDLIIDTVYLGLIQGKLDQKKNVFEVQYAIGRDIGPNDVNNMLEKLATWARASENLLVQLDGRIEYANKQLEAKRKEAEDIDKERENTIKAIKLQKDQGGDSAFGGLMGNPMQLMQQVMGGGGGDRRGGGGRKKGDGRDPRGGPMGGFGGGGGGGGGRGPRG